MISRAWETFKAHWKFLIPAGIITTLVSGIAQSISSGRGGQESIFVIIIGFIIYFLVSIIIGLGWSQVGIRLIRNNASNWNDFKTMPNIWWRYIVTGIICFLVTLPFTLLIIGSVLLGLFTGGSNDAATIISIILAIAGFAGLIWLSIRLMFLPFILIDNQDLKPVALLKKSFAFTHGHVGKLIQLGVWQFLVILLGLIALIIGLIVAIPVTYLSKVHMYDYLKSLPQA
jgi:hypothetical protein